MFSRARDASKVALVHLVARLRMGGFTLLDTQFVTTHLAQFGTREVPRTAYRRSLAEAIDVPAVWVGDPDGNAWRGTVEEMREES
jgi:leucyl/phenylalanyl-tRNA--protein transferase